MLSVARAACRQIHVCSAVRLSGPLCFARKMSDITPQPEAPAAQKNGVNQKQKAPPAPKKELKVLMLHGYTQSGPLFRAKTRALEKLLSKSLDPKSTTLTLLYPTAPIRLSPSDIPGFTPSTPSDPSPDDELDSWAWFRRNPTEPSVRGLETGMHAVADAIRAHGGVDAVVGFSQGGALAALVASVLEHPHRTPPPHHAEWASAVREANGNRPLRFALIYSGFFLPVEELSWCYDPPVHTPTLQYIGGLDTVVDEGRSRGLVERCAEPIVAAHPGGHYVPISREWVMPAAGFMKRFVDEMEAKI